MTAQIFQVAPGSCGFARWSASALMSGPGKSSGLVALGKIFKWLSVVAESSEMVLAFSAFHTENSLWIWSRQCHSQRSFSIGRSCSRSFQLSGRLVRFSSVLNCFVLHPAQTSSHHSCPFQFSYQALSIYLQAYL